MNFFATIEREASSRKLPYLVIGGYAVIAHGYPRLTFDFDLAVERTRQADWLSCVAALGYTVHHDGGAFLQLRSSQHSWEVDLMLLNDDTFQKLFHGSVEKLAGGVTVRFPSVEHLIALKVHALKHTHTRRFLKDFQDVVELVLRNKINLADPAMRDIFTRYGSDELYEKIQRTCAS
jgi:hypothetical protein